MLERSHWPYVWMKVAHDIADGRSHDPKLKVGCIIVPIDNSQVLAMGYNGHPVGMGNERINMTPGEGELCHAELNALVKCRDHHLDKVLYVTLSPCYTCASYILNARIDTVIFDQTYRDTRGLNLLQSRINVIDIHDDDAILKFVETSKKQ